MNVVFLSPHFPPNFRHFCRHLRELGVNVLGLADASMDGFDPQLKSNLTWYYKVDDMHNYDELVRALGFLTHRFGKLNWLDSHNEYWLETEAKLRTDFNIEGIGAEQIDVIKRKSSMKRVFQECGLNPARGRVCKTEGELRQFISEVGFPVVAKPDIGVGAAATYKIENESQIPNYLSSKPTIDYIVEEFISTPIVTFDGLADAEGDLVFSSSLRYSKGVMDAVNQNTHLYYYLVKEIEPALEQAGRKLVQAFGVRKRFFHFEFFQKPSGAVIPMEVNLRPPGGLTLDMFNYTFDFDCYGLWAEMVAGRQPTKVLKRPFFTIYVGRKDHIPYAMSHEEVLRKFGAQIVQHERIRDVFAAAIGNYGYILRNEDLPPLIAAADAIQNSVS
jgi:hypothetical protein